MHRYIKEIEGLSTYAPGAITQAVNMLSIHAPITDDLMQRTMKAAADLAAFKKMGIEQAAMMLGRASEGQFFGLQRMGVAISAATKESKNFADVLKDIERSLGGQAALAAETYHGKLEKIEHEYDALKKKIGEVFEPAAKLFTGAKLSVLEDLNQQAKESLEGGELKKLQETIENISRALFQHEGGGTNWLEGTLKALGDTGAKAFPFLKMFLDLLDKVGAKRKEAEGEKGAGPAEKTVLPSGHELEAHAMAEAMKIEREEWLKEAAASVGEIPGEISVLFSDATEKGLQYALIMADIFKNVAAGIPHEVATVDWKIEEKQAQAYFDNLKTQMEISNEEQKSLIWSNAVSKEEAEKNIAKLELENSIRKIQAAQQEHDTILALKEQQFKKEEEQLKARHPVTSDRPDKRAQQEADLNAAMKKLNEERSTAEIETNKKLSEAISSEIKTRESAYQKETEKQLDLQQKMKDAALETSKALMDVTASGATEWGKLTLKLQEAHDTLARALAELPKSPERAVELAKQAQAAFAALKQDIAALQKNLMDTSAHFDNLAAQIRQATMQPMEKREDEIRVLDSLIAKARQLRAAGMLPEAEAAYKEAGSKAAALAHPVEGQSPYDAQAEANRYFNVIRAEAEAVARQRLEQGKALNQKVEQGIAGAGGLQQQGLGKQLETVNDNLKRLTIAIEALNATLSGTKKAAPSAEAQQQAGISVGKGTDETAGGSPQTIAQGGEALQGTGATSTGTGTTTGPGRVASTQSGIGTGETLETDRAEKEKSEAYKEDQGRAKYINAKRAVEGQSVAVDKKTGEPVYRYAELSSWGGYSFKKHGDEQKGAVEDYESKRQALEDVKDDWKRRGQAVSVADTIQRSKDAEGRYGRNRGKGGAGSDRTQPIETPPPLVVQEGVSPHGLSFAAPQQQFYDAVDRASQPRQAREQAESEEGRAGSVGDFAGSIKAFGDITDNLKTELSSWLSQLTGGKVQIEINVTGQGNPDPTVVTWPQ